MKIIYLLVISLLCWSFTSFAYDTFDCLPQVESCTTPSPIGHTVLSNQDCSGSPCSYSIDYYSGYWTCGSLQAVIDYPGWRIPTTPLNHLKFRYFNSRINSCVDELWGSTIDLANNPVDWPPPAIPDKTQLGNDPEDCPAGRSYVGK